MFLYLAWVMMGKNSDWYLMFDIWSLRWNSNSVTRGRHFQEECLMLTHFKFLLCIVLNWISKQKSMLISSSLKQSFPKIMILFVIICQFDTKAIIKNKWQGDLLLQGVIYTSNMYYWFNVLNCNTSNSIFYYNCMIFAFLLICTKIILQFVV